MVKKKIFVRVVQIVKYGRDVEVQLACHVEFLAGLKRYIIALSSRYTCEDWISLRRYCAQGQVPVCDRDNIRHGI